VARGRAGDRRKTQCACALLLVDVVNDLEFDGGDKLLRDAGRMARAVASLAERARAADVPVIYANDNFGQWRSNFSTQVQHCLNEDVRGKRVVELLVPQASDYFVLKPRHSAFFETPLQTLLSALGVGTLVLCGIAGDNCVLFTAHDAYMRGYRIVVPRDGLACDRPAAKRWALDHCRKNLHAQTPLGAHVRFAELCRGERSASSAAHLLHPG
jgi:nicotinamidase-related amidase